MLPVFKDQARTVISSDSDSADQGHTPTGRINTKKIGTGAVHVHASSGASSNRHAIAEVRSARQVPRGGTILATAELVKEGATISQSSSTAKPIRRRLVVVGTLLLLLGVVLVAVMVTQSNGDDNLPMLSDVCLSSAVEVDGRDDVNSGIPFDGSTIGAIETQADRCGSIPAGPSRGFFYKVPVWGKGLVTASTCGGATTSNTAIAVYRGTCGKLECVAGSRKDALCDNNFASSVSWYVPANDIGEEYHVYVRTPHANSVGGNFELEITFEEVAPSYLSFMDKETNTTHYIVVDESSENPVISLNKVEVDENFSNIKNNPQLWFTKPVTDDGEFVIQSAFNSKCLEVVENTSSNYDRIQYQECDNGNVQQQWSKQENGDFEHMPSEGRIGISHVCLDDPPYNYDRTRVQVQPFLQCVDERLFPIDQEELDE